MTILLLALCSPDGAKRNPGYGTNSAPRIKDVILQSSLYASNVCRDRNVNQHRDSFPVMRVSHDVIECGGLGDRITILDHPLDMELEGLDRHPTRILQGFPGGDAAWKVGKVDPIIALRLFAEQCDVSRHHVLFNVRPDCFSMLRNVPIGMSRSG